MLVVGEVGDIDQLRQPPGIADLAQLLHQRPGFDTVRDRMDDDSVLNLLLLLDVELPLTADFDRPAAFFVCGL